jgi:hypothetical protein
MSPFTSSVGPTTGRVQRGYLRECLLVEVTTRVIVGLHQFIQVDKASILYS